MNTINFVKLNRVRLKNGMRERATTKFREFFASIQGKASGLKGYTILENSDDNKETLVLTFWGSKEDMDNYYSNGNSSLSSLVEEVKPMFEKMPERITYNVVSLDVTK
jgi:heme-degrading monooxygenase HmoA